MKILTKPGKEVHLILDKEEAKWLKNLVHEPFPRVNQVCETQENEDMRRLFWDACSKIEPSYRKNAPGFEYDIPF